LLHLHNAQAVTALFFCTVVELPPLVMPTSFPGVAKGVAKHLHLPAALCHAWVQLLGTSALQGEGYAFYGSVAMVAVWLLFYYNLG
jgi:hypothetical protein